MREDGVDRADRAGEVRLRIAVGLASFANGGGGVKQESFALGHGLAFLPNIASASRSIFHGGSSNLKRPSHPGRMVLPFA